MLKIINNLPFVEDSYETPSFLLKKENNYAPLLKLTNNVDYFLQINIAVEDLLNLLYQILYVMEDVENQVQEIIDSQIVFLRENYPLKYTNYAKSCSTINQLLFSNNQVEFLDAQLSVLYNELLNGESLTLEAESLINSITEFLNEKRTQINEKIIFINLYGGGNISEFILVTNYREQNLINYTNDKINEVNTFFSNYENQ